MSAPRPQLAAAVALITHGFAFKLAASELGLLIRQTGWRIAPIALEYWLNTALMKWNGASQADDGRSSLAVRSET